MSENPWKTHFLHQIQGLEEEFKTHLQTSHSSESSQSGEDGLLLYALRQQKIPMESYLSWARQHWELPSLKANYFTEKKIEASVWDKWKNQLNWSEDLLPIAEWDNYLIVAGTSPRPETLKQLNTPIIFILAPLQGLELWWTHLHLAIPTQKKSDTAITAPPPEEIVLKDSTDDSTEDLANEQEFKMENNEAPAGLLPENTLSRPKIQLKSTEELNPSWKVHTQMTSLSALVPPPPTVVPQTEPVSDTVLAKNSATNTKALIHPTDLKVQFYLENIKQKDSSRMPLECSEALRVMKTHFNQSLIVEFDESNSYFKVFLTDESFKINLSEQNHLDLKSASFFSIVANTNKSFHGKPYPSQVNDQFLNVWNQGQYPEHVTLVPLLVKEQAVGCLLGWAAAEAYNKNSLSLAEQVAKDLSQKLTKYKFLTKAA